MKVAENWIVRAPLPDEYGRLSRHFPVTRGHASWVIVAEAPYRIVGGAALQEMALNAKAGEPLKRGLRLECDIRPAWLNHAAGAALVDEALRDERAARGDFIEMRVTSEALRRLAEQKGFTKVSGQEVWRIPVGAMLALLESRGGRMLERMPVSVRALGLANVERVKKICAAASLLTPERVSPNRTGVVTGFDPGLSFFAGPADDPSAVLLAREYLGSAYLEALANNSQLAEVPATTVIALLRAFFRAVAELGLEHVTCAVRAGTNQGMMRLAQRCGATVIESMTTLRLEVGKPGNRTTG